MGLFTKKKQEPSRDDIIQALVQTVKEQEQITKKLREAIKELQRRELIRKVENG